MWRYINKLYCVICILGFTLNGQNLSEITIYDTSNSNLTYNQINCIEFDNEGRIWIGTQNGLSILNEATNNWDNIFESSVNSTTPWSSISSNIITTLNWNSFSNQPMMLIGTSNGITDVWWDDEEFGENGQSAYWSSSFGNECDPNNGIITTILQDNNERKWIGSTDGLCVQGLGENEDWLLQNTSTGFYSNNITSLTQNPNNETVAIGTMNGGLITYNDQFNIYYSSNSDILDNTVFDVVFDFHGLIKSGLITLLSGAQMKVGFHKKNCKEKISSADPCGRISTVEFPKILSKASPPISILNGPAVVFS